jgi:cell division protein FtsL
MSWKLAVLILVLGATACGLLVLRQQEIDMLAAQWDLRRQIARKEQMLQSLRWEIDELSRDQRLQDFVNREGLELEPLKFEPRFEALSMRNDAVEDGGNERPRTERGG